MRPYYQRDIYLLLAKEGPMRVRDIAARLGIRARPGYATQPTTSALQKMRRAGLVTRDGYTWRIVPGTKAPKCGCGHAPASKLALRSCARTNAIRLHLSKGHHPKPKATTALEQAWGWIPATSPSLRELKDNVPIAGGTVRPQETEAA